MKLYYASGACSFVPHTVLEASGAAFEPIFVKLHKGEHLTPEYLAMNPQGQVPVLVVDDSVLTQVIAICDYLDRRFPEQKIFPVDAMARAEVLATLSWMNNSVHTTFTRIFRSEKFASDVAAQTEIKATATRHYAKLMLELQAKVEKLSPEQWLSGECCGPVDAYAVAVVRWAGIAGIDPSAMPALWAYVNKVALVPAVARTIARERMELNLFKPA